MKIVISLFLLLLIFGRCLGQGLREGEGFVRVEGGRIWYKVLGSGPKPPLLIIAGGPGSGDCDYIEAFTPLSKDRPIIFYDQLGSDHSDWSTDSSLWRVERFADEIDSLRAQLGLRQLHLLGHSWGGSVLAEYLASKQTQRAGVASAIFASPLISTPEWIRDAKILLAQLPKSLQDTIATYESRRQYKAAPYVAATDSFYARHLSVKHWPPATQPRCQGLKSNRDIYQYMWGPTEFNATGTLKNFDRTASLRRLRLPVLFIAGEFDEARPETMRRFSKLVKNSQVVILPNSGHLLYIDQPAKLAKAVADFIDF